MPKAGLIRPYESQLEMLHRLIDGALVAGGLVFATLVYGLQWNDKYTIAAIAAVPMFYLFARANHLYQSYRLGGVAQEVQPLLVCWGSVVAMLLMLGYTLKITHDYSRIALGIWFLATPVALFTLRWVFRRAVMLMRARGYNTRTVFIVGTGEQAVELANAILARPWTGLSLSAFVSDNNQAGTVQLQNGVTRIVMASLEQFFEMARNNEVDIAYIALPMHQQQAIDKILNQLGNTTASIFLVPDLHTAEIMQGHWVTVGPVPTVSVVETPILGYDSWIKRIEDIVVASIVLLIMAIPMAVIAVGVKLSSPGPVLYRQKRYGMNCRPITVYKFRSMTVTESDSEFVQATKLDARVTKFGAFLRRTSLDELPQFFNVLDGSMSVVGPRPHAVAHNEAFRGRVHSYTLRHKIKPGITGLAQINGYRGQTETDDSMRSRIHYDIEYIHNWSLWMDLGIILSTPAALLRGENAY